MQTWWKSVSGWILVIVINKINLLMFRDRMKHVTITLAHWQDRHGSSWDTVTELIMHFCISCRMNTYPQMLLGNLCLKVHWFFFSPWSLYVFIARESRTCVTFLLIIHKVPCPAQEWLALIVLQWIIAYISSEKKKKNNTR